MKTKCGFFVSLLLLLCYDSCTLKSKQVPNDTLPSKQSEQKSGTDSPKSKSVVKKDNNQTARKNGKPVAYISADDTIISKQTFKKLSDRNQKKDSLLQLMLMGASFICGGVVTAVYLQRRKAKQAFQFFTGDNGKKQNEKTMTSVDNSVNNITWLVVGTSVTGKSHIKSNLPCQDSHFFKLLSKGWGIAIVCDGAGSARHSQVGSRVVAQQAGKVFEELLSATKWHEHNTLPADEVWDEAAVNIFREIRNTLNSFAKEDRFDLNSLACTLIIAVFSPVGLLVAHIGDGRAGYCNKNGEWKAMMTPHKGEEANQTIFISSAGWSANNRIKMSDVPVPETRVIREKATAFTLMSDGCEHHSFECSKIENSTKQWTDPNLPYPHFFNPLVKEISETYKNNNDSSLKDMWIKFIESGTPGLQEEQDDKTMILGIAVT